MQHLLPTSILTLAAAAAVAAASLGAGVDEALRPAAPVAAAPAAPADSHFLESSRCAECHSTAATANALWSRTGDDVSPHGTWKATMMANSFRDPYWRAQVSKEVAAAADDAARAEIEALCLKCHAPMVHHDARLAGAPSPGVFASAGHPLAEDGVSCTVCHQATGKGFGTEASFSGDLDIGTDRKIYGPYEDPAARPMLMHTGYTATHGPQIADPGLCATCHTLFTHHAADGGAFAEQAPFLEWRNSAFSNEAGDRDSSRTCQDCHMPDAGRMRIARNPAGRDFNIPLRDHFSAHTFVGGNAFMLDLMRRNAKELGITADPDAMRRNARATRTQLAQLTAGLEIQDATVDGGELSFDLLVTNRTGHKFPTGYPARRAWLHVQVRAGRQVLWESGRPGDDGRILGLDDERAQPHHGTIREPAQVQIYETVAADPDGNATTYLTRMVRTTKDNRLLPRGWKADGPHADVTAPVGIDGDPDFVGGEDRVAFRIPLGEGQSAGLTIVAWLLYQPVPPAWVDPLRSVGTDEAAAFVRMYDAAEKTPETVAVTVAVVGR